MWNDSSLIQSFVIGTVISKQCLLHEAPFHPNWQLDHSDVAVLTCFFWQYDIWQDGLSCSMHAYIVFILTPHFNPSKVENCSFTEWANKGFYWKHSLRLVLYKCHLSGKALVLLFVFIAQMWILGESTLAS